MGLGLHSLSRLNLSNCKYCCALPPVGQLSSLNELVINGLDGVVTVGSEFYGNNSSTMKPFGMLKSLWLKNMRNWEKWFPFGDENEGGAFPRLEKLYIVTCPKLRGRLPVHLHSLAKLEISDCQHLEGSLLIDSFSVLTHIKILGCGKLESLTLAEQHEHDGITNFNISCLQELIISGCSSLISLPMVVLISTLKTLEINNCKKLELPMHRQYSSLQLYLRDCCDSLTSFPLDLFPNLQKLIINGCRNLQSLEQHGGDLLISKIEIQKCPNFVSFPKGGLRAPNLADFILNDCESLRSMPDKMHLFLPSLWFLGLEDCPEVESFPEGGLPSNLKQIMICRCKKLIANWKGWGLQILPSLAWLNIVGESENMESFPGELLLPPTLISLEIHSFEKLKSFPGELLLPNLTSLKIDSFGNLKFLDKEGFQYLISLVQLEIRKCPKLKYMPKEGFPASLRFLPIEDCHHVLEKELARNKGKE
ncbi:hypothetical protein F2P56_023087 [Juglans regia]|uniref:Disease resistance protein At3g14460 n=1 Tax=Juglans regia TaxID=51240 RepID=A0A833UK11_JUGRE|nr:hypothetical protein F2P56_023088 [Juglans regia]KAF5459109.1 hypothetical protein F2P56_023087 [Juglans regia]